MAFVAMTAGCSGDTQPNNAETAPESEVLASSPETAAEEGSRGGAAATPDTTMAGNIRNALNYDLLKDELAFIPEEQRRFTYAQADLTGDGRDEYLVGFRNSYFCGSGGCTFLLLDHEGMLITRFTVSDAPFIVLPERSNGWSDLVVKSDGKLRRLVFDGKTYPSNPSIAAAYEETPDKVLPRLLDYEDSIPDFPF